MSRVNGQARHDARASLDVEPGGELDPSGGKPGNEHDAALAGTWLRRHGDVDVDVDAHGQTGAWKSPVRINFLFTNSWMPSLPSSRP